ncbi:hypothetical protein GCM10009525_79640 [Streptosporangium amethystogenes subsp. fukuiense]
MSNGGQAPFACLSGRAGEKPYGERGDCDAQALDDAPRGDLGDPAAHAVTDGVHVEVVALPYALHDRRPGRGHPKARLPNPVRILHGRGGTF